MRNKIAYREDETAALLGSQLSTTKPSLYQLKILLHSSYQTTVHVFLFCASHFSHTTVYPIRHQTPFVSKSVTMSEELQIKGSTFSSFAVLDKVKKLRNHESYLVWKREVTKILKMIKLWTYIEQPDEPEATAAKRATWAQGQEKTCRILRYVITGEVYDEIEYHTNASAA